MTILPHEQQIAEYEKTIKQLHEHNEKDADWCKKEVKQIEDKLEKLKKRVYSNLTPKDRVAICRHPSRPHTSDYIGSIFTDFVELCGDRTFGDDHSIIGGLAKIGDQKFMIIGQEKGHDTEARLHRNFGMTQPYGFRKALRLMSIAEKFSLPVISFIDTPGAYPGLTAEEQGQGWVIANNLKEMSRLATPIIVVIIGEGCSGGALGIAVGDVIGMLEHAYYSVISPEGCASILWRDAAKSNEAATNLKLNAENLIEFNIIDTIIKEPLGGAHKDPKVVYENVRKFILAQTKELSMLHPEDLIEKRYDKFRAMGEFSEGTVE